MWKLLITKGNYISLVASGLTAICALHAKVALTI